ncbi:sugar phosphate isomerase/epimerase family protein [Robiginitalea aurantiaca]|uniref:Sugar phosphate isomerase/epimerase family protein n=1 Tax=Robiginitalea aurantiaca TaxID=3056915 RepID=A0ABT7WAT5_9FLAO|nr:sugar phosphate isomerase/epimerase family protein [Robiginitalea aurantiaca]MDM9630033.1 sugar phosphate isomerase/epimerase family protein [Robiginitalea aurantiaca]
MKRRNFIYKSGQAGIALGILGMMACKEKAKEENMDADTAAPEVKAEPFFKFSLAQWSIHRMIQEEGLDPYEFAAKAKSWGFSGLEYVSQLYDDELKPASFSPEAMQAFIDKSNEEARKYGLQNLLIMIDDQGDLALSDEGERIAAVENHYKWVDAAQAMGCHSIRVNLSGSSDPEQWVPNSVDGLRRLATYASGKGINVLVENHGGLSSNAGLLAKVMEEVGMENCGTLPDFGNFCIHSVQMPDGDDKCEESYDRYKGVTELMPYAKAVSAKSNVFDASGNEAVIDYVKMLQIVKDAGYTGFIGVEYEGDDLSEEAGIAATRDLLIKAGKQVS